MIDTTKSVSGVSYNGSALTLEASTVEKFTVKAIDYDGTVLKEEQLATGETFTLPALPTHTDLVAEEWRCARTITNNTVTVTDTDITIGISYTTASGLNEFDIELTNDTGLEVTLNMEGGTEIDWGDGTTDTNTTHTYASTGSYTISTDHTKKIADANVGLFGQTSSTPNYYVTHVRLGEAILASPSFARTFSYCYNLTYITVPKKVTSLGDRFAEGSYKLKCFVMPNANTAPSWGFQQCSSLTDIVFKPSMTGSIGQSCFNLCINLTSVCLPTSISNGISSNAFSYTGIKKIVVPKIGTYNSGQFSSCINLEKVIQTGGNLGTNNIASVYSNCPSLKSISLPSTVTSLGSQTFYNCYMLNEINIPSTVTSLGSQVFYNCNNLTELSFPSGLTSIGTSAFQGCIRLVKYDFSSATVVPTLANTNAFSDINKLAKIIVPDALYENWITASNWVTYAEYIVKASDVE